MKRANLLILAIFSAALIFLLGFFTARMTSRGVLSEKPIPAASIVEKIPQTAAQSSSELVNINTASSEELQTLPHVGPKLAELIINYRTQTGQFLQKEQLMEIPGIGAQIYAQLEGLICIQ